MNLLHTLFAPIGAKYSAYQDNITKKPECKRHFYEIFVTGNEDRILLSSRFDNLGKGASGAAIQCMNIVMGVDEKKGLNL